MLKEHRTPKVIYIYNAKILCEVMDGVERTEMEGISLLSEETLRQIVCTMYLAICAMQDLRRRKISIRLCAFAGMIALALNAGEIVAIYVLSIKDTLKGQSKKIIYAVCRPKHANIVLTTIRKSSDIFGGFISGKIIDSAIIGIICYVGCLLLKMPQPMLIAVIIGVTNIIPVFGPFIGAIPTLFLVVIENPVQALYLLIFIIILQQVDGNIIGPKILGNSTGLSTFWVMFAILIGSGLFGFLGMLLGVPIFGVVYYIIKQLVAYGVRRRHLSDNTVDYINADHVDPDTLEIIPIDPMAKERERQREIEEAKSVLVKKVEEKIAEIRSGDHSESNDESKDDESKDE